MANSISLELARHRIALTSPDASGSIKKNQKRTTTIISWAVQLGPSGSLHWNHALDANKWFTPLCRYFKISCQSLFTKLWKIANPLSGVSSLCASILGQDSWQLADSNELLQDLMWKNKNKGEWRVWARTDVLVFVWGRQTLSNALSKIIQKWFLFNINVEKCFFATFTSSYLVIYNGG